MGGLWEGGAALSWAQMALLAQRQSDGQVRGRSSRVRRCSYRYGASRHDQREDCRDRGQAGEGRQRQRQRQRRGNPAFKATIDALKAALAADADAG